MDQAAKYGHSEVVKVLLGHHSNRDAVAKFVNQKTTLKLDRTEEQMFYLKNESDQWNDATALLVASMHYIHFVPTT